MKILQTFFVFLMLLGCSSYQGQEDCYENYCQTQSELYSSLTLPDGAQAIEENERILLTQEEAFQEDPILDEQGIPSADAETGYTNDSEPALISSEPGTLTNDGDKQPLNQYYVEVEGNVNDEEAFDSEAFDSEAYDMNDQPDEVPDSTMDNQVEDNESTNEDGSSGDDTSPNDNTSGEDTGSNEGSNETQEDPEPEPQTPSYFEPADVSIALVKACGACHEFVKNLDLVKLKSGSMLNRFRLQTSNRLFMPTANPTWPDSEDGRLVISFLEGLSSE